MALKILKRPSIDKLFEAARYRTELRSQYFIVRDPGDGSVKTIHMYIDRVWHNLKNVGSVHFEATHTASGKSYTGNCWYGRPSAPREQELLVLDSIYKSPSTRINGILPPGWVVIEIFAKNGIVHFQDLLRLDCLTVFEMIADHVGQTEASQDTSGICDVIIWRTISLYTTLTTFLGNRGFKLDGPERTIPQLTAAYRSVLASKRSALTE